MEPAFACNVSLYLRLVDPIYACPCESPTYNNRPEGVSLQRIGIKATMRGKREDKFRTLKFPIFALIQTPLIWPYFEHSDTPTSHEITENKF